MKKEMKQKIIFWTIVGIITIVAVMCTAYSLANLDRW